MKYLTLSYNLAKKTHLIAQTPGGGGSSVFGKIENPTGFTSTQGEGLFTFIGYLFVVATTVGGLFVLVKIIQAGFLYISSSGDPKKAAQASSMIIQSLIGIAIIAAAFILVGLIERFTKINILKPIIYGPNG